VIRAVWLAAALGCILAPVSELLFWPVHLAHLAGLVAFYGAAALFAAALLERSGWLGAPGVVLAAGVFGWVIEGVVVSQTYEAVPFSLSWTPLAWHGLLSVGVGLVALRRALLARPLWPAVVVLSLLGGFAGLWGAYGWERLAGDIVGGPVAHGFAAQVAVAAALLAAGHLLLDHLPRGIVPREMLALLATGAAALWSVAWAVPLFPVSLLVPALVGGTALLLWRARRGPAPLAPGQVGWRRYALFSIVPAVAIPLQHAAEGWPAVAQLNVWVALPTTLTGAAVWLWAAGHAARRRA
jgi:hypothetical protein